MDNYERADYGPGEIAALPPTIGLTSRAPTIGAEDPGRPIPKAWSLGLGDNGNGTAQASVGGGWLLPVGIGLALGGLIALMKR
jgi:hypothetical protein